MIKLSIITINFNNAAGLKKTIESVCSQTSKDFEYIIIDGGSTDNSVDVIKEFEDSISYWVSEKDSGRYEAMNKGIKAAKGEYCQFINSGDILVSNDVTGRMLDNVKTHSIYYGNMLKLINGKKICDESFKGRKIYITDLLLGTINHSSAMIKKELFNKYGLYDESLKIVSDWKFYLIAVGINNESLKYIDCDVTLFDMNGISNQNMDLLKTERDQVLKELIPGYVLRDANIYSKQIRIVNRLKNYKLVWKFVLLLNRFLSFYERILINNVRIRK